MAVLRLEALRQLELAIEAAVPALRNRVTRWAPRQTPSFPGLELIPSKFTYHPDQARAVHRSSPGEVVYNVGRHEGIVQLRLAGQDPEMRAEVEQLLLDLFTGSKGHPGALITPVTTVPGLGAATCVWELEEEDWDDANGWTAGFWSTLTITAQIPALVTRGGTFTIRTLKLALDVTRGKPLGGVTVRVDSDGTLTRL